MRRSPHERSTESKRPAWNDKGFSSTDRTESAGLIRTQPSSTAPIVNGANVLGALRLRDNSHAAPATNIAPIRKHVESRRQCRKPTHQNHTKIGADRDTKRYQVDQSALAESPNE
jgi:hypothetical protein